MPQSSFEPKSNYDVRDEEILRLKASIQILEGENNRLKKELEFLKIHPSLAQGLKGERLIARLAGGLTTRYADPYDIVVKNGDRFEVKFSHANSPNPSRCTRWSWANPLGGSRKAKDYDYLLLVGEDNGDRDPYVFFLVPRGDVPKIVNTDRNGRSMIVLVTSLNARSATSQALKGYQVSIDKVKSWSLVKDNSL